VEGQTENRPLREGEREIKTKNRVRRSEKPKLGDLSSKRKKIIRTRIWVC